MSLLRKWWLPLLALAALTYGFKLAWDLGGDAREHKFTERILESEKNERLLEQQLQLAVQDAESARLEQVLLRSDLAAAGAANGGLRDSLKTVRATLIDPGKYSGIVEQRDAAVRAAMVLTDLLGRCSDRVVELGGAFDQANARGKQCQAQYTIVRDLVNKAP